MHPGERIKQKAVELGFDLAGIAPARPARHALALPKWLAAGFHGEMAWLARNPARRSDPRLVLEGARSMVTVGLSYFVENPPAALWNDPSRGRVARYAWGADYHDQLTPMLRDLAGFIEREVGPGTVARYYVDTGPVLERDFAAEAGLGFIGRNTLLIHPGFGSYLFLGVILVNRDLPCDKPAKNDGAALPIPRPGQPPGEPSDPASEGDLEASCGNCRRCLDACPTHAFPAPYILDSRKCISYLTIELRNAIPETLRPGMGNWIFGCDACQSVCPWVKRYARPRESPFLAFNQDQVIPELIPLMGLDDHAFRARFRKTPVARTKRRGLLRNVAVALGNWGDPAARPCLERALHDPEPLIAEHARWALQRLG
jgi:epoxyqueuosine reductase